MQKQEFLTLVDKYLDGKASPSEERKLLNYYNSFQQNEEWDETHLGDSRTTEARLLERLQHEITKRHEPAPHPSPVFSMTWTRVAAAAIIIICLSVGGYFYFNKNAETPIAATETQQQRFKNDIAPGGTKALLTLSDGTTIVLDSAANGTLTQQGGTKIIKLDNGQLAYNASGLNGETLFNTISTPNGGQYQIILSDGSKVYLNAASSIRFPASFAGHDRNVEMTGEAYFEVAHSAKPFTVSVNGMNIQVLGTHFNVNAYDDENIIKTTLFEGSVKLAKGNSTELLKPGQQGQLDKSGDIKISNDADLDEVMAWKDGRFQFKRTDIKSIMRQLSRWYNVEVVYKNVPQTGFNAKIPRNTTVSNILKALELTGEVKFIIDGNVITVMQ